MPAVSVAQKDENDVRLEGLIEANRDRVVGLCLLRGDAPAQIDEGGGDAQTFGEFVHSRSDSCCDQISLPGHVSKRRGDEDSDSCIFTFWLLLILVLLLLLLFGRK